MAHPAAVPLPTTSCAVLVVISKTVQARPMMGILDDHDYGVNDCHLGMPEYESWKSYAKDIFLERFGVPSSDERRYREGLYTHRTFGPSGRRTQMVMLDTRWFRSQFLDTPCKQCPGRERYVPYNDSNRPPAATMLGETQWQWLEGVLREPADLRLIFSTVQLLAMDHGYERWGLIPTEVARLIRLVNTTRANGVVVLSGDPPIACCAGSGTRAPTRECSCR